MKDYPQKERELKDSYGKITEEFTQRQEELREAKVFEYNSHRLCIKYIAEHYYLPVLVSDKADYISNILNEHIDKVYIPYYDPFNNSMRQFKPDFIFWLSKGKDYFIVFVDPKSIAYVNYEHKADEYRALFEKDRKPAAFTYNGYRVRVFLFSKVPDLSRKYWFDNIDNMLKELLSCQETNF